MLNDHGYAAAKQACDDLVARRWDHFRNMPTDRAAFDAWWTELDARNAAVNGASQRTQAIRNEHPEVLRHRPYVFSIDHDVPMPADARRVC